MMPDNRPVPTRTLRQRPDLDQLRRQAKELLQAFRDGDKHAAAEVHTHYRAADVRTFALHDAQLVIARSYGFDSWPKLKAYVDGVTVQRLADAVIAHNLTEVRAMIEARPELVNMDMAENNEHRALHYAVLHRSPEIVRVLMQAGAEARKGIYPHRAATTALALATDRGYDEIVAIIQEEEQRRREQVSGSQATASGAQDELIEAIWRGEDAQAIVILEAAPARITAADRRGWSPLHAAARVLNEALSAWLIAHGADVNQRGPNGRTPLDLADGMGWRRDGGLERYGPVAHTLRQHGAELTPRSAVALGEADWVRAHHAAGTLHNPIEGPGGLLSVAVRHDPADMLELLLDLGLDPDERTRLGDVEEVFYSWGMPLHHCAGLGKLAMAEMLLQRGADPNGQVYASGSVMYSALYAGDRAMAELLERHGGVADAATVGHLRLTDKARQILEQEAAPVEELLWAGLRGGDPEIVRMSLERIAWPREDPEWFGKLWSPLPQGETRTEADHRLYLECFRQVLERCDPDIRHPWFGRTILHDLAAVDEDEESSQVRDFARILLDAGASTGIRDHILQSTPLGWACRWGHGGMAKLLLERGADPVEPDAEAWATPRAWAGRMGRAEILELLNPAGPSAPAPHDD